MLKDRADVEILRVFSMKIIKHFSDPIYAAKYAELIGIEFKSWHWGLSDSGDLYFKSQEWSEDNPSQFKFHEEDGWIPTNIVEINFSIYDMKRIVKAFGHLVLFI
jgi:hypothetical protein